MLSGMGCLCKKTFSLCVPCQWFRLKISRDIIIKKLLINVKKEDSSYMPCDIVISTGTTTGTLKEIKRLSIPRLVCSLYFVLHSQRRLNNLKVNVLVSWDVGLYYQRHFCHVFLVGRRTAIIWFLTRQIFIIHVSEQL